MSAKSDRHAPLCRRGALPPVLRFAVLRALPALERAGPAEGLDIVWAIMGLGVEMDEGKGTQASSVEGRDAELNTTLRAVGSYQRVVVKSRDAMDASWRR